MMPGDANLCPLKATAAMQAESVECGGMDAVLVCDRDRCEWWDSECGCCCVRSFFAGMALPQGAEMSGD